MKDVRISIIDKRLENIRKIIGITGGKGGIGKSSFACLLALSLSEKGQNVGIIDLDLTGPSIHNILGIKDLSIKEDKGIIPPTFHGIKFMSAFLFSEKNPLAFRGTDITNAIIEILSNTIWGKLDFLIVDMPPSTSDTILDVIRFIKKIEFLVVFTPSAVVLEIVQKHIEFLRKLNVPILGIIENMKREENTSHVKTNMNIPLLLYIPYEKEFENALGNHIRLKETEFFKKVQVLASELIF